MIGAISQISGQITSLSSRLSPTTAGVGVAVVAGLVFAVAEDAVVVKGLKKMGLPLIEFTDDAAVQKNIEREALHFKALAVPPRLEARIRELELSESMLKADVLAPLFEEALFRVGLQGLALGTVVPWIGLSGGLQGVAVIGIASLIFGFVHRANYEGEGGQTRLNYGDTQDMLAAKKRTHQIVATILGVLTGMVYQRYGYIPAVVLHATYNRAVAEQLETRIEKARGGNDKSRDASDKCSKALEELGLMSSAADVR